MEKKTRFQVTLALFFLAVLPLLLFSESAAGVSLAKNAVLSAENAVSLAENSENSDQQNSSKTGAATTGAESYFIYNIRSKSVLASQNQDIPRAPASTTKLLTGLVAAAALNLDDVITVGAEVDIEGSRLGLAAGDQISVRNLLTAVYVSSANDAAAALAVETSGSVAAFAEVMNSYAAKLGCTQSHFTNPHGLPDSAHVSSAGDMAKIALAFIGNDTLLALVQMKNAVIEWQNKSGQLRSIQVSNSNKLLGVYPGVAGLKTGTTTEAGQCLISYFRYQDGEALLVLLGAKQRYQTMIPLLDQTLTAEILPESALSGLAKERKTLFELPGMY
ncbi:MAG: serine hydrolase [Peptococcaceae bacterium]|jgi:D-alanyl-D-alanine carboxypeptidase (penicillin-binding protein 5/6)|nr:serine hydrolase [Peptococcaceae bacterium]